MLDKSSNSEAVIQFWILDFGFWIDSTDKSRGLYHEGSIGENYLLPFFPSSLLTFAPLRVIQFWILDFGFWIDSTDKSRNLYHEGSIGENYLLPFFPSSLLTFAPLRVSGAGRSPTYPYFP